jgi:hypothetical protein
MEAKNNKFWFPAKRFGWGWAEPTCWQGWTVMIGWQVTMVLSAYLQWSNKQLLTKYHLAWFGTFPFLFGMFLVVAGIYWAKGEKPRWR